VKVGVRVPCYRRWCRGPEVRSIATTAEAAGFDSLWVQDHLVAPTGPRGDVLVQGVSTWMSDAPPPREATAQEYYAGDDWWLEPYVTWGFMAAVTTGIQLASDVIVVPYRNPIVQAKMLGTLDVLSGGRMVLGTGSGHVAAESAALGLDFAARGRQHDEHLRVIRLLLGPGEEVGFDGEFYSFGPLRPLIDTVQQPPPIYVGGNGRRSIRRAADLGDGWLPSVSSPHELRRGLEALDEACAAAGRSARPIVAVSLPSAFRPASPRARAGRRPLQSPAEVVDELGAFEALGVDHVALGLLMPDVDVYLDQIEFVGAEVLPALPR
jgi:probable F420-dependent oxidoreductase